MLRQASVKNAADVVRHWGGDRASLKHLGDSASSVFTFERDGERCVLKLTDRTFRRATQVAAECEFVSYLHVRRVNVASPLLTFDGEWVAETDNFVASACKYIDGERPEPAGQEMLTAWGRALAQIHEVAATYDPDPDFRPMAWMEEPWIKRAMTLFPAGELRPRKEFMDTRGYIDSLPATPENFGPIHGDHGPQNFRYDSARVTSFDFGNCCYHFYVYDLAVALSTFRRHDNREAMKQWLLEGYREVRALLEDSGYQLNWFLRFRVVYVYLSRLFLFGPNPRPEQQQTLTAMRARVEERKGW